MNIFKVYYMYSREEIKIVENEDDTTSTYFNQYKKIRVVDYDLKFIGKAFEKEDGDGDDTGSYADQIILITDNKGAVYYDLFKDDREDSERHKRTLLKLAKYEQDGETQ